MLKLAIRGISGKEQYSRVENAHSKANVCSLTSADKHKNEQSRIA
jgi:hypothetical protein